MSELHPIPQSWQWVTLQDIAEVVTGNTPPTSDVENYGGEVPFIKPPQLNDLPLYAAPETLSKKGLGKARVLSPKSVLVSCIGILGKTAITKIHSATNQQINAAIFESNIQPEYGFYYSQTLSSWLRENSSATTVAIINKGKFETAPFPLPPAVEQTRIVAKLEELLSDLDAGVAELKAAQKKLGQYRQSLLKAAVEGALTADWRSKHKPFETGAQLLERILTERRARWEAKQLAKFAEQNKTPPKDWQKNYPEPVQMDTTDLPELPEGWVWSSIGQCFHVAVGATPSRKELSYWGGAIPWVSSGEVRFSRITSTKEMITQDGLNNSSTQINPIGSVLLGMIGEGKTRGQVAILDIPATNNQNCAAIWVPATGLPSEYVYFWLWSQYEQTRRGSSGNNQPALNKSIIERICFPLAPLDEMHEIVCLVNQALEAIYAQEMASETSFKQSAAQRQNILRAAFAGQLVPQDPNDEPASVLLERIRAKRAERDVMKKPRGRKPKEMA